MGWWAVILNQGSSWLNVSPMLGLRNCTLTGSPTGGVTPGSGVGVGVGVGSGVGVGVAVGVGAGLGVATGACPACTVQVTPVGTGVVLLYSHIEMDAPDTMVWFQFKYPKTVWALLCEIILPPFTKPTGRPRYVLAVIVQ